MPINATHDAALRSWVESANDPASDFPIQNLPICTIEARHDGHTHAHPGVLIGDQVLDCGVLYEAGFFSEHEAIQKAMQWSYWRAFLPDPALMSRFRAIVQQFLSADSQAGQQTRRLRQKALRPIADTTFHTPVLNFNYTDFYASKHHASNVGAMFRPDNPLLPNYTHVPIGYHGRSSSIVVSGTPVRRPKGQLSPPDADPAAGPSFGPCKLLDYELELGLVVASGNPLGEPIAMSDVSRHMFGVQLLNDWSARDIQKWEYQPLGPFLAKNFATSVGACVVTMEALEPFRVAGPERDAGDPRPLEYLRSSEDWGLDITLEVLLQSEQMRAKGMLPHRLSSGSFTRMYWTLAQMLVHHTSNGCNMMPGDLLGSGTVSGPERSSRGCLLELTWDGIGEDKKPKPRVPITLPTGETRTFLADGDEVVIRGHAQREGFRRIGLGECRGRIVSAAT